MSFVNRIIDTSWTGLVLGRGWMERWTTTQFS
jgi:hypothetical protein